MYNESDSQISGHKIVLYGLLDGQNQSVNQSINKTSKMPHLIFIDIKILEIKLHLNFLNTFKKFWLLFLKNPEQGMIKKFVLTNSEEIAR